MTPCAAVFHMTSTDVDPTGDRISDLEGAPIPRVPRVHRPYLVALGLYALANAASLYVPLSKEGSLALVAIDATRFLVIFLHLSWVSALFKDAERSLGQALPMPPARVVAMTLIACMFMPVWSAFAYMILLRSCVNALEERGREGLPAALRRGAEDAPAVIVAAGVWIGVHIVVFGRIEDFETFEGRVADVLGETGAPLVAAMHIACTGYWLWFIARTVPALYRGFQLLQPNRGSQSSL